MQVSHMETRQNRKLGLQTKQAQHKQQQRINKQNQGATQSFHTHMDYVKASKIYANHMAYKHILKATELNKASL